MDKTGLSQEGRNRILRVLMLVFAALRIINFFYVSMVLQIISAVVIFAVILIAIPRQNKLTTRVGLMMAGIGVVLLVIAKASPAQWLAAILKNGNLVMMLTLAPMLSQPFFYEDYQSELKTLAQVKMQSLIGFLILLSLSSHLLGVLVSVGAVIIVYDLLHPFGKLYKAEKPFITTITRSYSSSGFWSPAWACVVVYSTFPDVHWIRVVPIAILFAIIFNGISIASFAWQMHKDPSRYPKLTPPEGATVNKSKIITMLVLFCGMIGTIILIDAVTGWDLMLVVAVASLAFPLIAALVQKKWPAYGRGIQNYCNKSLLKIPMQVTMYISAGFLGKALEVSGIGAMIPALLPDAFTAYPPLMIIALVLLIVLPALAGIHPVATGTALTTALNPAALGLTNYTFALTIIFGWIMGVMLSPLSTQNLILSGETGRSNWDVSVQTNWKFCSICILLFSILISLIGPMMG
ncbi:MAG: hypothetical protein IJF41_07325 [Clostridia bacterium]|nr:hypothetical protein [Clostridia bacterium]